MGTNDQDKKTNKIAAYKQMLERVRQGFEEFEHETLHEALEHAKETAIQVGEVSQEEAENIVNFIHRDVSDAAHFLNEAGDSLKLWLRFDLDLIESQLWQTFSKVADKTKVDRVDLEFRLLRGPAYCAGEYITFGTLQCDRCGEMFNYYKISPILPCGTCNGREFSRIPPERRE